MTTFVPLTDDERTSAAAAVLASDATISNNMQALDHFLQQVRFAAAFVRYYGHDELLPCEPKRVLRHLESVLVRYRCVDAFLRRVVDCRLELPLFPGEFRQQDRQHKEEEALDVVCQLIQEHHQSRKLHWRVMDLLLAIGRWELLDELLRRHPASRLHTVHGVRMCRSIDMVVGTRERIEHMLAVSMRLLHPVPLPADRAELASACRTEGDYELRLGLALACLWAQRWGTKPADVFTPDLGCSPDKVQLMRARFMLPTKAVQALLTLASPADVESLVGESHKDLFAGLVSPQDVQYRKEQVERLMGEIRLAEEGEEKMDDDGSPSLKRVRLF